MASIDMSCAMCGTPSGDKARYCAHCGAALPSPAASLVQRDERTHESGSRYSLGFVNTMRLLAAACMFSAMYAALTYETTTHPGRLLVMFSVGVAMVGMMFVFQVSRTSPTTWANALLPVFRIGILALIALWAVNGLG